MSTTQQPEALAHAATLEALDMDGVANFVRRLHAENTTLQASYAAARLEIESLRTRCVEPVGERTPKDYAIEHAGGFAAPAQPNRELRRRMEREARQETKRARKGGLAS